jgi:signal transduction histidine kinase
VSADLGRSQPPKRARVRARLAVGLTVSALVVAALVGIGASALASWRSDEPEVRTQAGAARVGEGVALVVVAEDDGDAAAQARSDALRWMLVALGVALIPAVAVGWLAAGRLLGTVDRALADIEATDAERRRRLQEVVHELRTPLAVVGANLELASTAPGMDDEAGGLVDAARRAAERMRRTVDDLAGHGQLAVDAVGGPLDLGAEAQAVVADHAGPAGARGVRIATRGTGSVHVPSADRGALHTALGNLAANAVRLAPIGSTVTVCWGDHAGWAWIAVCDEGPGLAERLHARVFERGWQGRHERDRAGNGDEPQSERGLGLTIARQLTEAQGGLLTLVSEEGAGSTFTVWLPLGPVAQQADVVEADGIHPRSRPWQQPADVPV